MARYRKKPVVIAAIQWTGENLNKILEFTDKIDLGVDHTKKILKIITLEGTMIADINDWISELVSTGKTQIIFNNKHKEPIKIRVE